jgi:hypothetical protein
MDVVVRYYGGKENEPKYGFNRKTTEYRKTCPTARTQFSDYI